MSSSPSPPSTLLSQLSVDGFVIIRDLLTPTQLLLLRGAASRAASRARSGDWPDVRTVGKQFPPWPRGGEAARREGVWGVQGLLNPDRYCADNGAGAADKGKPGRSGMVAAVVHGGKGVASHAAEEGADPGGADELQLQKDLRLFTRLYFSDALLGPAVELMQCSADADGSDDGGELVMELLNMLIAPPRAFALRWHRDDIPDTATAEEEEARLCHPSLPEPTTSVQGGEGGHLRRQLHAQYNLALYPDTSLVVVPGSHRRARTSAERAADPFDGEGASDGAGGDSGTGAKMPGQLVVRLGPGDCVFYDNNIVHRGVYVAREATADVDVNVDASGREGAGVRERLTVHGSVGHAAGGGARARNVLQHGVGAWVDRVDLADVWRGGEGDDEDDGWGDGTTPEERTRLLRRAEAMRERLVRLGRDSGEVGYSLDG